jgi:hypothetical protein
VARAHAIAAVIEDTADQESLGLHPCGFVTVHLFAQLGLDRPEQQYSGSALSIATSTASAVLIASP